VSKKRDVSISLTAAQITQVVRESSGSERGVSSLLATLNDLPETFARAYPWRLAAAIMPARRRSL
jgi:hypothetical protein